MSKPFTIQNHENISKLNPDFYYHLGLSTLDDLPNMFGDVKYVLTGGSPDRMEYLANRIKQDLNFHIPTGCKLSPIGKTERYSMFKVGPVLIISHGIGTPSLLIVLHEISKLLAASKAKDFVFIRTGTCGGLGVDPGTVIISSEALNGLCQPCFSLPILGKIVERVTHLDELLRERILQSATSDDISVCVGKTLSTNDFYEGQGRTDGAVCYHTEQDKQDWLEMLYNQGVRNIEMEADCFSAYCYHQGIPCAIVCSVLVNRLEGDQVKIGGEQMKDVVDGAIKLIIEYLRSDLKR